MKRTALLFAFLCVFFSAIAQKKVIVQGTYPNLFIQHKVVSGETISSIGRLYNLVSLNVAKQNGIDENAILAIDKIIKIPLDSKNFTQDGQSAENETLVPVYHSVKKGDNLFRIGQLYGNVRMDFLREWNDLNSDVIVQGQKLVIGHLKVDKKKFAEVVDRTTSEEESGYAISDDKKKDATNKTETNAVTNSDDDEGIFVTQFSAKGNEVTQTGDCATFKTTSGWTDRKYYVLMNNVTPGTIVRITASNNKSVCAKVLGALPDMKENSNLLIRVSNAAASVLRMAETKFTVKVSYYN
jgi:LysM repeat protein